MYRSRTVRSVQMSAVLRLFVPGLLLTLLVFAVFSCARLLLATDAAGPAPIASAAAPAAVTAQELSDHAGLLAQFWSSDSKAPGRGCSTQPSFLEGSPSPRIAWSATGFLPVAKPLDSPAIPAVPYRNGHIGPAPPAPTPILLSVLRI